MIFSSYCLFKNWDKIAVLVVEVKYEPRYYYVVDCEIENT